MKVKKVLLSGAFVGILFILATGICWAERMSVKVPKANVLGEPGKAAESTCGRLR